MRQGAVVILALATLLAAPLLCSANKRVPRGQEFQTFLAYLNETERTGAKEQ